MNRIKATILTMLLLLHHGVMMGQFDVHFSQYWKLNGYYNPAWAGQNDKLNVYGVTAMQLSGFTNPPRTMYFGADMPFKFAGKRQGFGAGFFSDALGLFKTQSVWLQYSYKTMLGKGRLGIGAQGGFTNSSFDPTNLDLGDDGQEDPAFPTQQQSGTQFDCGAGIYYSHHKGFASLSVQHLTSPTVDIVTNDTGEKSEINIKPSLYLSGGYNIQSRNPLVSIQPSVLVQSDFSSIRVDLTSRVFYTYGSKRFDGGVTYSPGTSFTVSIGAAIRSVSLGYSYEIYTSKIGIGNGSHELTVGYSMDINMFNKSRNLHKSIRIL